MYVICNLIFTCQNLIVCELPFLVFEFSCALRHVFFLVGFVSGGGGVEVTCFSSFFFFGWVGSGASWDRGTWRAAWTLPVPVFKSGRERGYNTAIYSLDKYIGMRNHNSAPEKNPNAFKLPRPTIFNKGITYHDVQRKTAWVTGQFMLTSHSPKRTVERISDNGFQAFWRFSS